jgi:threonylcarbamoyladenosine tRNA methylthiotransferase MtaB
MVRIAIATLGCKANQYDSEMIRERCEEKAFRIVPFSQPADIYVINTCTVTGKTDYQSRQLIRQAHRRNPNARIVVTGCYAQVAPEKLREVPGVSWVVGTSEKRSIAELIASSSWPDAPHAEVGPVRQEGSFGAKPMTGFAGRTRFFLKIQDGCDARCSYCIVPTARGASRSMPPEAVQAQLRAISTAGFTEVVLTGIHLGAYGLDLSPPGSLLNLLQEIERVNPIARLRLSSIEPNEVTPDLVEFIAHSSMVCPHLHLPLQSGDDTILGKMNRPYRAEDYRQLIHVLRKEIADIALGVDVIVGFPGEGDAEFSRTLALLEELPVTYLHVFPFSLRPGTPAAVFSDHVDAQTRKARVARLRTLSAKKRTEFYYQYLDRPLEVLIEAARDKRTGLLKGFSRNYIPVLIEGDDSLNNREVSVTVTSVEGEEVRGILAI